MPRSVISLSKEDKSWLDSRARTEGVPMTELVRRAARDYREKYRRGQPPEFEERLDRFPTMPLTATEADLTKDFPPHRYPFVEVPYIVER